MISSLFCFIRGIKMTELEEVKELMHHLHDGVPYHNGLTVADQVQGTVDKIEKYCNDLGVEYKVIKTDIAEIVFNQRKE